MTFFFCSSRDLGRKMDMMTFFFALHLILGGKLGICGRDDLQKTCPPGAQ